MGRSGRPTSELARNRLVQIGAAATAVLLALFVFWPSHPDPTPKKSDLTYIQPGRKEVKPTPTNLKFDQVPKIPNFTRPAPQDRTGVWASENKEIPSDKNAPMDFCKRPIKDDTLEADIAAHKALFIQQLPALGDLVHLLRQTDSSRLSDLTVDIETLQQKFLQEFESAKEGIETYFAALNAVKALAETLNTDNGRNGELCNSIQSQLGEFKSPLDMGNYEINNLNRLISSAKDNLGGKAIDNAKVDVDFNDNQLSIYEDQAFDTILRNGDD